MKTVAIDPSFERHIKKPTPAITQEQQFIAGVLHILASLKQSLKGKSKSRFRRLTFSGSNLRTAGNHRSVNYDKVTANIKYQKKHRFCEKGAYSICICVHLYRLKECVIEYKGDSAVVSIGASRKRETHED